MATTYGFLATDEETAAMLERAYGDRVPGGGARWLDQNRPGWRDCKVEGCERPVKSRRLCGAHYQRLLRYGDPLGTPPPRPVPTPAEVRAEMRQALDEATRALPHSDD